MIGNVLYLLYRADAILSGYELDLNNAGKFLSVEDSDAIESALGLLSSTIQTLEGTDDAF